MEELVEPILFTLWGPKALWSTVNLSVTLVG